MFSMVLFSGVRDAGSIDSQLELEACRVLIQAGRPSTVPVSELESLKFLSVKYVSRQLIIIHL